MESNQIPFNYFYRIFQDKFHQKILEINKKRISEQDAELDIFDFLCPTLINKEEKLLLYNQILFDICADYAVLTNSSIEVFPKDTLEFVSLMLDTIQENPYKESFLFSLQFIYQNYLDCLEKGNPILMATEDSSTSSYLKVTLDSQSKIINFDAVNMDFAEQDKIITKILTMETNNQLGPIPKVAYHIRKDI